LFIALNQLFLYLCIFLSFFTFVHYIISHMFHAWSSSWSQCFCKGKCFCHSWQFVLPRKTIYVWRKLDCEENYFPGAYLQENKDLNILCVKLGGLTSKRWRVACWTWKLRSSGSKHKNKDLLERVSIGGRIFMWY
jgi:hypothetical protein